MVPVAQKKSILNSQRRRFQAAMLFFAFVVIVSCAVAFKTYLFDQSDKKVELNLTGFRNCTVSFQPPKAQNKWNTKPIWIPAYPTSLKESTHKSIINQLTGLGQGGKSYYASSKNLKKCFGPTETATCNNVHPLVDMAGGPDKKSDKFYPNYIMAIRNPMAAIPAFVNEKQIKYHGGTGQMGEAQWRIMRDEHIEGLMKEWQSFFRAWKKDSSYKTGMYIVYEDLYDVDEGPKALKRLRNILHEAGFIVAPEVDIPCIWFNAIGEDELQQNHMVNYEYNDYIPGYTNAQKQLLLTALSTLVDEYKEDKELTSILQRYSNTIKQHTRIDEINVSMRQQ